MDALLPLLGILGLLYLVAIGIVLVIEWIYTKLINRRQRPRLRRAALIALLPAALVLAVSEQFNSSVSMFPSPKSTSSHTADSALAKLPIGSATVVAPEEVLQYQGFDVLLTVAKKELADLIDSTEAGAPPNSTVKGIAGVRMSPRMKAELVGEDFIIEDKGPQEQVVTLRDNTVWKWRVHSEMTGPRILKVRLHTLIKVDGQEAPRTIEVAEAQVEVKVNPSEWALRHWEWIASALVLPFVAWGFKRLTDKDKK